MLKGNVAYFGIPGSFSHSAALKVFDSQSKFISSYTFEKIFQSVEDGTADYGVFPIENSLAGSIYENYDLLAEYKHNIVSEEYLKIEHYILVAKDTPDDLSKIDKIYSHPKALKQCSNIIKKYPDLESVPIEDTASAAKFVADHPDENIAAISSKDCAQLYDLKIIESNAENSEHNFTRFLVISKNPQANSEKANKASLILDLPHEVGSLSNTLNYLTSSGCNLTKIESRPINETLFQYNFYVDFTVNGSQSIVDIINGLNQHAAKVINLGIYPANSHVD